MGRCVCLLANCKLDEPTSRINGIGQGYQVGREVAPVHGGRLLVNLERVVCVHAALVTCLCQPKKKKGCGCLGLCLI